MAGLRDLDSGKIYIGPEEPKKLDKSVETKNGDKPYDGTLAVTGPAFVGGHSPDAKGVLNVGTDLGDFKPNVTNRAVDVEGDVNIDGDTTQTGKITAEKTVKGKNFVGDISTTSGTPPGCKLFDLPHPNIKGHRLRHACVEGPEAAVYVRGTVTVDGIIELPDYWQNFVDKETITVHLTPRETHQELFVKSIEYGKRITIRNSAGGPINAYYQVWADRLGHDMIVEYKGESAADYPGDSSNFSVAGYDYDVRGDEHQWNHGDGA